MSKREQFEVIKPQNLPKIGTAKHKVGGSKLKLMGQPPQEVYRKLHLRMYECFPFMCVAEYLRCHAYVEDTPLHLIGSQSQVS